MLYLTILALLCLMVLVLFWLYNKLFEEKYEKKKPQGKEAPPVIINKKVENTSKPRNEVIIKPSKMRYLLFNKYELGFHSSFLYEKIVIKNLWIDEPFHTSFYNVLLFLKNNNFFIKDKNSKVLTLFLRDDKNKTLKSNSYQVFSAQEILIFVLENSLTDIYKFKDKNAKDIVLAICVLTFHKSQHFLSLKNPNNLINEFIDIDKIQYILDLIEENDERLLFIKSSFKMAFLDSETYPYIDNLKQEKLQISYSTPQKYLQEI
jgi:hypothetical protein